MMKTLIACLTFCLAAPAFASDAAAVQDLWRSKCKSCHGPDGKAQTRMGEKHHIVDFTTADFQKGTSDAKLRDVIENGSKKDPKMKAFSGRLTSEEISALVRYIRALGPQR